MCQSSTGNGKSVKQREREQRAGWFSEETTGRLLYKTLCITVLFTVEIEPGTFFFLLAVILFLCNSTLLVKFHREVRCQVQLEVSILLWLKMVSLPQIQNIAVILIYPVMEFSFQRTTKHKREMRV